MNKALMWGFTMEQNKKIIFLFVLVSLFLIANVKAIDWDSIAYYRFDEEAGDYGNIYDELGTYDMVNNKSVNATGKIKYAYDFERTNEQSIFGNFYYELGSNFSVATWIKLESNGIINNIVSQGNSVYPAPFQLQVYNNNKVRFAYGYQTAYTNLYSDMTLNTGTWYYIVATHNGVDGSKIYINGDLNKTGAVDVVNNIGFFFVGTRYDLSNFFDGVIDEISIWNRTLNSTEISELYNSGNGLPYPDTTKPVITVQQPKGLYDINYNDNITLNYTAIDPNLDTCYYSYGSGGIKNINLSTVWLDNGFTNQSDTLDEGNYSVYLSGIPNESNYLEVTTYNAISGFNNITVTFNSSCLSPQIFIEVTDTGLGGRTYDVYCNSIYGVYIDQFSRPGIGTNIKSVTEMRYDSIFNNNSVFVSESNCIPGTPKIEYFNLTDERTLYIYAVDLYGNYNSTSTTWDYTTYQNSITYNNETFEGSTESFILNITTNKTLSEANLIYNGTSYTSTFSFSGNDTIIQNTIIIPEVGTDTNITFYWTLDFSDSSSVNTSMSNQTVKVLSIDNCSSYTNKILNFTLLDEETQEKITDNTTISLAIRILSEDRTTNILNLSAKYEDVNPVTICLNSELLDDTSYSLDAIVKYEAENYSIEYYNIQNYVIEKDTPTNNISLYDLLEEDATEFRFTFRGSDFLVTEGVLVYVLRQYVSEDVFKTVELPKTDSNGQTLLHLVKNDIVYNIRIVNGTSGEILGYFENLIAFCEDITIGKCEINLNAFQVGIPPFDYDAYLGIIISNPGYDNNTRTVSFDFTTTTGTAKTVTLEIIRSDIFGNRTICNNSVTSSAGTITCQIPLGLEDSSALINLYVDGQLVALDHVDFDSVGFGEGGYIVFFFMFISIILMFSSNKNLLLIGIIIGLASGIGLGLINDTMVGIGSGGIFIIVIVIVGLWKINKGRIQ